MKRLSAGIAAFFLVSVFSAVHGQTYQVLHRFSSSWANPYEGVTLDGSTLLGTTAYWGAYNGGTVFKMNTDGTGFQYLHEFNPAIGEGNFPSTNLTLNGSTMYGATNSGWGDVAGTLFKLNTDGSGFAILHAFTGGSGDGLVPYGDLALSGSTLYGTTSRGGSANVGTVFKISTDGNDFGLLHTFTNTPGEQGRPSGGLTLSGTTLYGTTTFRFGSSPSGGSIFKMNTDGGGFSTLYTFSDANVYSCSSNLLLVGSVLYGTADGPVNAGGILFRINTDGTGFTTLHSFNTGPNDGWAPRGPLTISGSMLYGTTMQGGISSWGTVYQIDTDGSDYRMLYSFTGIDSGYLPSSGVVFSDSTLYGTAGDVVGAYGGTVYALTLPEPSTFVLFGLGASVWGLSAVRADTG